MRLNASSTKEAARRFARRLGLDVRRYQPRSSLEACREVLLRRLGVNLVLDAGANRGQYGAALRASGYDGRIVSFEPLADPFRELASRSADDSRWDAVQIALGDERARAVMNVSAASASSSLLDPGTQRFDVPAKTRFVGTEEVDVAPLDEVALPLVRDGDVVYLKVDVQGYELAVLAGAGALLPRVGAVEIELSLVPLYDGQPLWREVLDVLAAAGFSVFSLAPSFADQTTGRLLQIDAICSREA